MTQPKPLIGKNYSLSLLSTKVQQIKCLPTFLDLNFSFPSFLKVLSDLDN